MPSVYAQTAPRGKIFVARPTSALGRVPAGIAPGGSLSRPAAPRHDLFAIGGIRVERVLIARRAGEVRDVRLPDGPRQRDKFVAGRHIL